MFHKISTADERGLETLTAEVERIDTTTTEWQTIVTTRTFATDPEVAILEEERDTLELRYLQLQGGIVRRHLERAQRLVAGGLHPLQVAAATRAQSEEAQRKVEEARRKAVEEAQPLQQEVADLHAHIAEILNGEITRHEQALHDLEVFRQRGF